MLTLAGALIDKVVSTPIVNPPSSDMLADYYMFSVAPAYNFDSSFDFEGLTVTEHFHANLLFFNLSKIKADLPPKATSVTISANMPDLPVSLDLINNFITPSPRNPLQTPRSLALSA